MMFILLIMCIAFVFGACASIVYASKIIKEAEDLIKEVEDAD